MLVPGGALEPQEDAARQEAGRERDAEVDGDAHGDLADRDVDDGAMQAEPPRQEGREEVGVDREEQHLEDRVEGDQTGAVLAVALRQIVPHDHHGDAAREPDQDEADHVLGPVAQEEHREAEHEHRSDDPVLHERQEQHALVSEDAPELLVADLGEGRVHHQDEPDGDGDAGGPDAQPLEGGDDARRREAEGDAHGHGREDPQRQVAVQEREASRDALGRSFIHRVTPMIRGRPPGP